MIQTKGGIFQWLQKAIFSQSFVSFCFCRISEPPFWGTKYQMKSSSLTASVQQFVITIVYSSKFLQT